MDHSAAKEFLDKLWTDTDVQSLECCHCGSPIGPRSTLARTFCLKSQKPTERRQGNPVKCFEVPELHDEIIVFDRHLECLFHSVKYVAISHVWPRDVADAQYKRETSTASIDDVARTVREAPARICKGLTASLGTDLELWHDYISVPQWRDDVKHTILQAIHHIFEHAMLTTVYSSDLDAATYQAMWHGASADARCRAISDICNIKYFSRVWTAMEFTQSRNACFMTKDFTFLSESVHDETEDGNLFTYMNERWDMEVEARGYPQAAEEMVGMGYNLVPWQLGPLELVRRRNSRGLPTSFANAHTLLARRCVTIEHDFVYALQGILKLDLTEQLHTDVLAALRQMARGCLKRGDFSPLFIMTSAIRGSEQQVIRQSLGFNDVGSFGLGAQRRGPTYGDVKFNPADDNLMIKAERLGEVQSIEHVDWWFDRYKHSFAVHVRLVLEHEILGVDEFVQTLGCRLLGQDIKKITTRLSEEGRRDTLQSKLELLSGIWSHHRKVWDDPNKTFEIVLDERPTLCARDGSGDYSNQATFDLAACLGNRNGRFDATGDNFHLSARALALTDNSLTAELRTIDGRWVHDEIDVRSLKVLYSADGSKEHLDWIADAMGLSNRAFGSEITPLTPIEFLHGHGDTIHWGERCAFVNITCGTCHQSFLVRTALFSDDARTAGSTAWRIPGLRYDFTLEGGAGFLLDGDRIVGRFLWAVQTCECPKLEEVEVFLHDPPVPRQNTYEYGKSKDAGWIPIRRA